MLYRHRIEAANYRQYLAAQQPDAQRRADILADARLAPQERGRVLEPLEAAMKQRFERYRATSAGHLEAALRDHDAAMPLAQLTAAANDSWEKAARLVELYRASPPAALIRFARAAAAERDLVAGYALSLRLADTALDDGTRATIGEHVASLTAHTARQADAALFAFRTEALRLEVTGWQADEMAGLLDGPRVIGLANEIARLPREGGGTVSLSSRQQAELLKLSEEA